MESSNTEFKMKISYLPHILEKILTLQVSQQLITVNYCETSGYQVNVLLVVACRFCCFYDFMTCMYYVGKIALHLWDCKIKRCG